jgi:hypothetical protein
MVSEEERRVQDQHLLLLRLRNQVRQLRDQLKEASAGQAATARLPNSAQTNSGAESLAPEAFIAKSALSNVGLDTPEAAAQTFYWCLREGNVEHLVQCVTPDFGFQGWHLFHDLERVSPQDRPEFIRTAGIELQTQVQNFRDFQIASREDISPEVCRLRVKSSASRGMSTMTLRHMGGLWRVDSAY